VPWIVVSVSDEGYHDPAGIAAQLRERGHVAVLDVDYKRYVGAQIGIHNPAGKRVGKVSHLRTPSTCWCGPDERVVTQVKQIQL
jgi:adenine-specific DNA-methyltransferase